MGTLVRDTNALHSKRHELIRQNVVNISITLQLFLGTHCAPILSRLYSIPQQMWAWDFYWFFFYEANLSLIPNHPQTHILRHIKGKGQRRSKPSPFYCPWPWCSDPARHPDPHWERWHWRWRHSRTQSSSDSLLLLGDGDDGTGSEMIEYNIAVFFCFQWLSPWCIGGPVASAVGQQALHWFYLSMMMDITMLVTFYHSVILGLF